MEKEKEANFGGVIYIFCRGGENRRTMSGKINKYVVLKADFNCKCLSVYFIKYLFYQSLLYLEKKNMHFCVDEK